MSRWLIYLRCRLFGHCWDTDFLAHCSRCDRHTLYVDSEKRRRYRAAGNS